MDVNIDQIKALAELALEKNLAELTVQEGDKTVTIKLPVANTTVVAAAPQSLAAAPAAPVAAAEASPSSKATPAEENYYKVTSPMVGSFYAAPSPDSPPYVAVGQSVSKGQTLCIIEAMKMMNELESEVSGKIVKILVDNGQPVEFGQPLMLIDPS